MYEMVDNVSRETIDYLKQIVKNAKWKDVIGPDDNFKTWFYNVEIREFPHYKRAFFLMIPPRGKIHRHKDTVKPEKTYHIPVETNPECVNSMYPGGDFHLEVGLIYAVDRQIEHESFNNGQTNRIHLLVEV